MGRRRKEHQGYAGVLVDIPDGLFQGITAEGLYPMSNVIYWRPRTGRNAGSLVRINLDIEIAEDAELRSTRGADSRYFYSAYYERYPWAVGVMAQGLNTYCLTQRCSRSEASYVRSAIGEFFEYCAHYEIGLESVQDFNYDLMCRWRQYLRSVPQQSRFKSAKYRRVGKVLEILMGTSVFPTTFPLPVYTSDSPKHIPTYSDAVMYQLISLAISEIKKIMSNWPMTVKDNAPASIGDTHKPHPTKMYLFPFFLFFIISCGKNKETVCSWQRRYKVGNSTLSPLDWKDPLDPNKCRLRGWKIRGKRQGHYDYEDVWINISSLGSYPFLEYLLWYTRELASQASLRSRDSLWLFRHGKRVLDFKYTDFFNTAASSFLKRHCVWDTGYDNKGNIVKERLKTLDSRRFRKVYASNEFLKAVNEADSFQELANQLTAAMRHKEFDTTIGSYLSLGKPKELVDLAIFTLQKGYVEAARKFRGKKMNGQLTVERPGLYTGCADPMHPDYEGSSEPTGVPCNDYDMCMGCTKSRVFSIHLPRIAARIMQYESMKPEMSIDSWEQMYGRKSARAYDLLNGWANRSEVEQAWAQAKSGSVHLPKIVITE